MKATSALVVALALQVGVAAQSDLITKETFMDFESVGSPAISPDGANIIFTRTSIDKMRDAPSSNLWITDPRGERVRQFTEGSWRDSSPVFSPDGKRVAMISDRDGTSQLYVMWLDTREVAKLTNFERGIGSVTWSHNGTHLAFTSFVPQTESPLAIKLPERPAGAQWARGAIVESRLSWAADGAGYRPVGWTQVFIVDARLGGTPKQITTGDFNHANPQWSADGKTIYVSAIRKPDAEHLRGDTEIYAFDIETKTSVALTDRLGPDGNHQVSPDGQWIAYTGFDQRNYTSHLSSLYLMDKNGGSKRMLAGDLPSSPGNVTWTWDNSGVYFTVGEHGATNVRFVSLSGDMRQVTQGAHQVSGFSLARNGRAVSVLSHWKRPGVLTTFDIRTPDRTSVLVDVNEDVLDGKKLADIEELWYESSDGLRVQGWLVKPIDFDPTKKYPMVLWIHGGPWSMYGVGWNWAWQNWAAMGYAVLFTNPRGSTGYGQAFVNGIQFSYPGRDYDDLMAGVDTALAKGWIDERNMFVCGGSGGGVLTAWIVGHTDRFAAACSMRPVINWHSFVGTTDGPSWYYQFEAFPWEDPMEYARRSPLSYVHRVSTPVLVMTGEADLRTPMAQSEEYYRALKMLKKDTLLVRMPEEYHGWRRPSRQLAQQLYLLAWFEKFRTRSDEAGPEYAPESPMQTSDEGSESATTLAEHPPQKETVPIRTTTVVLGGGLEAKIRSAHYDPDTGVSVDDCEQVPIEVAIVRRSDVLASWKVQASKGYGNCWRLVRATTRDLLGDGSAQLVFVSKRDGHNAHSNAQLTAVVRHGDTFQLLSTTPAWGHDEVFPSLFTARLSDGRVGLVAVAPLADGETFVDATRYSVTGFVVGGVRSPAFTSKSTDRHQGEYPLAQVRKHLPSTWSLVSQEYPSQRVFSR